MSPAEPTPTGQTGPALVVVIPAYQPDDTLIEVVAGAIERCKQIEARTILFVVNDGSAPRCRAVFDRLAEMAHVRVLEHAVNLGKGAALRTAFNQALLMFGDDLVGVVTADADGQHLPDDIGQVARRLLSEPEALTIGSRSFGSTTPFRSRFGNTVTRWVFRLFTGRAITDTQSGLRGLPRDVLKRGMRIPTQGYDFELEMLIEESQRGTKFVQQPIATVYEPGNPTSHFNPLLDSAKIYYVFVRFSALALLAAFCDQIIFFTAYLATHYILASIALARLVTGVFYFKLVRRRVFRSEGPQSAEAVKFVMLVIFSMMASYGLITLQVIFLHIVAPIAKVLAEFAMFFVNFAVQRVLVFRPRRD